MGMALRLTGVFAQPLPRNDRILKDPRFLRALIRVHSHHPDLKMASQELVILKLSRDSPTDSVFFIESLDNPLYIVTTLLNW